jgi:hypothetical protein
MHKHIVSHPLPDEATEESSLCAPLRSISWKAASRLGLKWLGGGGAHDSTPHDFTHGRVKWRLAVHHLFLVQNIKSFNVPLDLNNVIERPHWVLTILE